MNTTELLSTDELLHLAIDATERSQNGSAIEYLRRLLALRPDSADAHYLLGAQLAQIGLLEQGADSMGRALALRPDHPTARFQLGLVMATIGRIDEAERVWRDLDQLEPSHAFRLFKEGILHVAREAFAQGIARLEEGIAANRFNAPLNEDMAAMAMRARAALEALQAASGQAAATGGAASTADVPPMFLDAYSTGKAH